MTARCWTAVGLALLTASPAFAESLGAAAKREKERRERQRGPESPPVHVITQEELASNKGRTATDGAPPVDSRASSAPAGPSSSPVVSPSTPGAPASQAAAAGWAARASALEADIAAAERALAEVRAELPSVRLPSDGYGGSYRRDDLYQMAKAEHDAKVKAAEARLAAAKRRRDELDDEARQQSIPPGWLRGQVLPQTSSDSEEKR